MKRIYKNSCLIILCLVLCNLSLAQSTADSTKNIDSSNKAALEEYNTRLDEIEKQRVEDSIIKAKLEEELKSLKTTDNLKKEELQNQLLLLKQKEVERLARKKRQIDSLRLTATGYPVKGFFGDTLFTIYNRSGSFSARERAIAITDRITALTSNINFKLDSLKLVPAERATDIVFKDVTIISVSENDAMWNDTTQQALAESYRNIIGNAILKYRSETSYITLAKEIGLALLVILVLWIIIYYTNKFYKWTALKIRKEENKRIKGLKIRGYTLLDPSRMVSAILFVNTIFKWLSFFLLIYIALPILFGIFPWTEGFTSTLFGYILTPLKKITLGVWHYLPKLITIIVIITVFRYILKGIHFLKMEIDNGDLKIPGFYADWANPTYQIVRVLIFAFMIVVIFPYLPGSDSPIFKGVSVFLGFLFTFGSAGSLSNVIAGLVLTYMRLFTIGDRVKIGEVTGDVIEKSLLVTRIRTTKNEIISIPNSTVMNSHTINYSIDAPGKGLIIYSTVTIGYDVPWKKIHEALIEAALRTNLILKDPAPFVLQTGLEDFYVSYQVNAYIRDANKQAVIYSDLHQNIQDVCNEEGIEILSPHYRAERDGNMTTIPADYLPKDYKPPFFNININKPGSDEPK